MALDPRHQQGCARLGIARLNAFRLNVYESVIAGFVNGVDVGDAPGEGLRIAGAGITHNLNDAVDTAQFVARGFVPIAGHPIAVYDGDRTALDHAVFGGRILETTVRYEGDRKDLVTYDLRCIDPTWLLNRRKVLATYTNQSATAIVLDLVAKFARGVTTRAVVLALPVIDAITFTNEDLPACLTNVCERIGGAWYLGYDGDLHVFLTESEIANPITDATPRGSKAHALAEDLSQVVTRVIGRGGGEQAAIDVPAGATEIPVEQGTDQSWYAIDGGLVEINTQKIQYSGVRGRGGTGSFVGSGNAPSGAPVPAPTGGSSHQPYATYKYAASWTTAAGETLPSPQGSITLVPLAMVAPPACSVRSRGPGSSPPGLITPGTSSIRFVVQIWYEGGAIGPSGAVSGPYTWDGYDWEIYIGAAQVVGGGIGYYYPLLEPGGYVAPVNHVTFYRSDDGGQWQAIASNSWSSGGGWYYQICAGYSPTPGGIYPSTGFGSVIVRSIPIANAAGVTGRKLYRTTANGSALKLLATIANNTATEYGDTVADAALGAAPPASDTSGIKDEGTVAIGATTLPVASTTPFADDAAPGVVGWVRVGSMPVRYTAIGAGILSGIPASGNGSITAAVRYGTQVLTQPRLVGIPAAGTGAITTAIKRGDQITIRLERQNDAAIAAFAARLGSADTADGIVEDVISDSRYGLLELADHIDALLLDRKDPRLTLTFQSRDPSLQVGRLVTINLASPPIAGTFRITRITFTEIAITGGLARLLPLRTVEATNKIFTFADFLRQLRGRNTGVPL